MTNLELLLIDFENIILTSETLVLGEIICGSNGIGTKWGRGRFKRKESLPLPSLVGSLETAETKRFIVI